MYQTLKSRGLSLEAMAIQEHRRSLLAYSVAKRYRMENLVTISQLEITVKDKSLPVSPVLENLKSTFSNLDVEDTWLEQYLRRKINEANDADETFLSSPMLSNIFQPGFERALFKSIANLGNKSGNIPQASVAHPETNRISSNTSKPDRFRYPSESPSLFKKSLCREVKLEDVETDCEKGIMT